MVKSLCTTESCLKLGENGVYADLVCGATQCLCKNRPQYINSTVSAGYNSYRGRKKHKQFPRNLRSLAGDGGPRRVCIQYNGMFSESLGKLENK